jgi:hypothetical protein
MADGPEKIAALISTMVETKIVWLCSRAAGADWKNLLWFRDETTGEEYVPFFSSRDAIEEVFARLELADGSSMPPFITLPPRIFFVIVTSLKRQLRLNPFTDSEVRISFEDALVLEKKLSALYQQAKSEKKKNP